MTKPKREDIKRELGEEEDEFYGEETASGSSPSPDSDDRADKLMKDVIGNEPEGTLAEEVEKDEEERRP